MRQSNIFIILVNYKNYPDTEECIESLKHIKDCTYHIVVVDNYSNDGSTQRLRNKFGEYIEVIENEHNYGFGIANNIGMQYAISKGATHILLLNNDTTVEPSFIKELIKRNSEQRVCVPKILSYYDNDTLWYAGGDIDRVRGTSLHYGMFKKDSLKYSKEKKVNYLTGCCALIPVSVIEKIGMFGIEFFLYFEDMDLSLRCLYGGIDIVYVPSAIIYHKEGASSGGKKTKLTVYYANRNRFYILKKYRKYFGIIGTVYTYLSRLVMYIYGVCNNNNYKEIKKAFRDFKLNRMGESDI